jgi:hypothetical protein
MTEPRLSLREWLVAEYEKNPEWSREFKDRMIAFAKNWEDIEGFYMLFSPKTLEKWEKGEAGQAVGRQ